MASNQEEGLHRANMEASALFAAAAYFTLLPQGLLALGITKTAEALNLPAGPLNSVALGLFATAVIVNGILNWRTIREHGWCSDVHLNVAQGGSNIIGLRLPLLTTMAGTAATVAWSFAANPVDWMGLKSLYEGVATGQPDAIAAGTFMAKSIVPTIYSQYLNHRIHNGTITPVVNAMKKVDAFIDRKIINPVKLGAKNLVDYVDSPNFNYWLNAQALHGLGGK